MTDFTSTAQNIQLASQALNKLTHSLQSASAITTPALTATSITTTELTVTSTVHVATSASIDVGGAFSIALSGGKLMVSASGTPLFSIDSFGNVIALGTITPSAPP